MEIPTPIAPKTISSEISALCERLVVGGIPVYLTVNPSPEAVVNECYQNVEKAIAKNGGNMQCGWQIWETIPGVMIEAEFHAVWKDASNIYHDLTPKELAGIDRILFLPDPHRKYEGKQVDNVRIPLVKDQLLDQFIENETLYFEATNKGSLANYHGVIELTHEIKKILEKRAALGLAVFEKYFNTDESKSS